MAVVCMHYYSAKSLPKTPFYDIMHQYIRILSLYWSFLPSGVKGHEISLSCVLLEKFAVEVVRLLLPFVVIGDAFPPSPLPTPLLPSLLLFVGLTGGEGFL